jgi:hypothetical protein
MSDSSASELPKQSNGSAIGSSWAQRFLAKKPNKAAAAVPEPAAEEPAVQSSEQTDEHANGADAEISAAPAAAADENADAEMAEAVAAKEGSVAGISLTAATAQSLAAQVGDKEKQVCAELSTVTVADLQAVLAESVNVALGSVCSAGGDFETSTEAISEDLLVSEPEVVPHFFKPQDLRQRLLTIQRLETPSRAGGLPELAQQLFEKCVDRAGALGAALMTRLGTDCAEGSAKGIAQYIPKRGKKVGGEEVQYIDQVDLMQARIKSVKMMAELADATKAPSTASRWKYEIDFNTQLCEKKVTSVYQTKLDVVYLDLATLVDALPTAPAPGMDPTAPGQ